MNKGEKLANLRSDQTIHQESAGDIYNVGGNIIQPSPSASLPPFPYTPAGRHRPLPDNTFIGRFSHRKALTDWWNDPQVSIGTIEGWFGEGKTSAVRKWYDDLDDNDIRPDGTFWWTFEETVDLELFLDTLLAYVSGDTEIPGVIKSASAKVESIKSHLARGKFLLILDSFEYLLHQSDGPDFGNIMDSGCSELLQSIAEAKEFGLCILTSRLAIKTLEPYQNASCRSIEMNGLDPSEAIELFRQMGIEKQDGKINALGKKLGGHAHSLSIVAKRTFLDFDGEIQSPDDAFGENDIELQGATSGVMEWYDKSLSDDHHIILELLTILRPPTPEDELEDLLLTEMPSGHNRSLASLKHKQLRRILGDLCDRRIVRKSEGAYSLHLLIRNWAKSLLSSNDVYALNDHAYRYYLKANDRVRNSKLYGQIRPSVECCYHAVKAGHHDDAFEKVWRDRLVPDIRRAEKSSLQYLPDKSFKVCQMFFRLGDPNREPLLTDPLAAGELMYRTGAHAHVLGHLDLAENLFIRSEALYGPSSFTSSRSPLASRCLLLLETGRIKEAMATSEQLELAIEKGDDQFEASTRSTLGHILLHAGRTKDATEQFSRVTNYMFEDDDFQVAKCEQWNPLWAYRVSEHFILTGETESARRLIQGYERLSQKDEDSKTLGDIATRLIHGRLDRLAGAGPSAADHLQYCVLESRRIGVPGYELPALIQLGHLAYSFEEYKVTLTISDHLLRLAEQTGFLLYRAEALVLGAYGHLGQGEVELAKSLGREAYEISVESGNPWIEGMASHFLGECTMKAHKDESAVWLQKAVDCRVRILDPNADKSRAMLASLRGYPERDIHDS